MYLPGQCGMLATMNALARVLAAVVTVLTCTSAALGQPPSAESIGSTRNAKVAYPMPAGARAENRPKLVYLAANISDTERDELAKLAPNVQIVGGLTRQTVLAHAGEAHGVDAHLVTPEFLSKADHLVWVQAHSAGVDRYISIKPLVENDRIVLTNMRAVHGPAIADHAFAMLLTLTRDLRAYEGAERAGREADSHAIALQGRTMLVVGIGGIGTEIAQRAHGFGMRVIATRRTDTPAPDYVEKLGKPEDLAKFLPEADVVAVCVPLTKETEHLFGAAQFELMKKGAYLINIARGRIVDTGALVGALTSGRVAGACLDVTDPEPLPAEHPLRSMANVVITPHVAADAELTRERAWAVQRENVRRFGAGEPLLNCVDKRAGY